MTEINLNYGDYDAYLKERFGHFSTDDMIKLQKEDPFNKQVADEVRRRQKSDPSRRRTEEDKG